MLLSSVFGESFMRIGIKRVMFVLAPNNSITISQMFMLILQTMPFRKKVPFMESINNPTNFLLVI